MPPRPVKADYDTESAWYYLGDLPDEHVPTMRRVMVLIYHKLNPTEKIFPAQKLQWIYLTRKERKRVIKMLDEAKDNDVLEEMLRWFSAQFMSEDKFVEEASSNLRAFVDLGIRWPKLYQVEYLQTRKEWDQHLGRLPPDDDEMEGTTAHYNTNTWPGLSSFPSAPSKFITSVSKPDPSRRVTRLTVAQRNTLNGVKPYVDNAFHPSYSHSSNKWREESCFGNAASAEWHYTNGWGETSGTGRKRKAIEPAYEFTDEDLDTQTEVDPDDVKETIDVFTATELPGKEKKTRSGTEFATFVDGESITPPKKVKITPKTLVDRDLAPPPKKAKVITKKATSPPAKQTTPPEKKATVSEMINRPKNKAGSPKPTSMYSALGPFKRKSTPIKKEIEYYTLKGASKEPTPVKPLKESPKSIMKRFGGKSKAGTPRIKWAGGVKAKMELDEDTDMADYEEGEVFEESYDGVVIKEEYDEEYRPHTKKHRGY